MTSLYYGVLSTDRARINAAKHCHSLPCGSVVRISEPTRSLEQSAKMWAMLSDIARQVPWPVDGAIKLVPKEDWKEIITAGLKQSQRVAQGIEGGFVILGSRTSQMSIRDMTAVIEFAQFFGDSNQVVWSEPLAADPLEQAQ